METSQHTIQDHSLYQTSNTQIVLKNFLAGFSRGMGTIVAQLIFLGLLYLLFLRFVFPQVAPLFALLERTVTSMEQIQETQTQLLNPTESGSQNVQGIDLQELLQQLNTGGQTR